MTIKTSNGGSKLNILPGVRLYSLGIIFFDLKSNVPKNKCKFNAIISWTI